MTIFTFANNVSTTLAGAVSNSATTITLASTANLPTSIPPGEVLVITLNDAATRQNYEIVYATARTGATLTVLRAQEGTAALAWLTGDYAFSPPTAGQQNSFGQLAQNNTWSGNNTFSEPVTIPNPVSTNQALSLGLAQADFAAIAGSAAQVFSVASAITGSQAVNLGQLISFGGNAATSSSGTSISTQVSFTAPQNCVIFAIGSGGNAGPISSISYAVANANIVFQGGNFATASGGVNNVAPAYGIFTATSGASVLIRLNMAYTASSTQNVNFMYLLLPTP